MSNIKLLVAFIVFFAIFLPLATSAESMTSTNYTIEAGRVGSGVISIPDATSTNYWVEISPGQESVYTPTGYACNDGVDNDGDGLTDYPNDPGCSSAIDNDETDAAAGGPSPPGEEIVPPAEEEVPPAEEEVPPAEEEVPPAEEEVPPLEEEIVPPTEEEVIPPEEEVEEAEKIPEQLFDINLEIDEYSITDIKELTSRVLFTSFGRVPTPVNLTFVIEDEAGQEVYVEKDYIIVETEAVLTKKFESLELAPGKYTLRLSTLYNVDVRDEFRQDFEIIELVKFWETIWFKILVLLVVLLVIILVILLLVGIRRKKLKQEEQVKGR